MGVAIEDLTQKVDSIQDLNGHETWGKYRIPKTHNNLGDEHTATQVCKRTTNLILKKRLPLRGIGVCRAHSKHRAHPELQRALLTLRLQ